MKPQPLYIPHNLTPAYTLHYDWTGWTSGGTPFPLGTKAVAEAITSTWKDDGLELLKAEVERDKAQLLFSVTPEVSPVFFAARVKGRLPHQLRSGGTPVKFSRKVSVRTLGDNRSKEVRGYIGKQVGKEKFADPRYEKKMREFTIISPDTDLAEPATSKSGRYWYNLHVVLVSSDRFRVTAPSALEKMRNTCFEVAKKKGHCIAALSVMPDHIHIALQGNVEDSPQDIALGFQNNLAYALGQFRAWEDNYYVGTFSEYELKAVLGRTGKSSSPATQGRGGR